ncbi:MAG: hypothetical protein NZM44_02025 [Candidatus Calescibacterium sp.]|nr:hypothetical protein [Candidatus Calescibacterium sp.]
MDTENKNVETSEFVEIMREELKEEEEKPKEISEDTVSKTFTGEKAPIVDMDEFIADYYARTVTRLLTDKILSKEKGKEFRDVIGLAQNFLLEGPPGVGKTTALFLFHNYILPYLVAFEYIRRKYEIDEKRIVDIVFKSPDAIRINIQNKSIVTKGETKRITQQGSSPIGIVNPYLDDYINFMLSSSDYKPLTTFGALLKASYLETGSKGRIDPRIIEVIDNEKIKNMIKSLKVEKISDFSEFTRFVVSMNFKLPTKIVTRTESGLEETEKEEEVKIEYMWTHLSLSAMSESLIENIKVGRSKRGEQNVVSSVHSVLKDSLEYSDIIVVDEYNRAPKETLEAFLGATSTMSNKVFVFIGNLGDSEGESFVEMHSTREGARIVNAFWERVKPFAIVPGKIYRPPIIYIFSNMLLKRAKENKEVTDLEKAREIATNKVETIYDILVEGHNYSSRMVARLFQLLVSGVDIDDILLPNEVKELLKMLVDPTKEVLKIDEDFKKVSQELSKKRKDYKNLTFKDIVDKERSLVTMVDSILSEAPLMNITGVTMDYYIDYVLRPILNFFFSNDKDTNEPLVLGAFGAPGTAKTTLITEFLNKRYPYELQELMKAKSSKKQPINKQTVHVSTIKKQNTDVMKEIEGIHNSYDVIMKQIISKIKNLKGYLEKIKEKVEQALNLDKKALEENNLIEELNKFIKVVDNIIQFIESLYGFQQIIHTGEETEKKIEEIEKSIQETMKEINKQETGNQEKVTVRTISDLIAEINNFISEKFYHPIIQQIKQFRPTENREKYIKEIFQISEEIEKISEQINAIRKDAKKLYLNVKKIVYSHATAIIHMVRIGNIGYNWSILTFSESDIKYLKTMVVPKVLFP